MTDLYDVIVVGSGPAGSTASYELAKGGLKVLALDKEKFPRYKPCGGALSSRTQNILSFNFQSVVENTINGISFTNTFEKNLPVKSDKPIAFLVKRESFDNLLVEKAREMGAEVRDGQSVRDFSIDGKIIEVFAGKSSYKTRFLIGADGPFSVVKRRFFPKMNSTHGLAIEAELETSRKLSGKTDDMVRVDFGCINNGYGWAFPKNGVCSVGVASLRGKSSDLKKSYQRFIAGMKLNHLKTGRIQGWTIPTYSGGRKKVIQGNVLLLGDAANMVDPFIGEGIYYAIKGAKIASKAILNVGFTNPAYIHRVIKEEMTPDLKAANKVAKFIYNFPDLCYDFFSFYPELMGKYFDVLKGESTYSAFYVKLKKNMHKAFTFLAKKGLSLSNKS